RARRVSDGISARHRAQRATDITGERPRARPAADEASLPGGVSSRTTVNGPAHAWEAPSAYAEGPGARRAPGPGDDGETGSARRRLLLELEPGCIRNALLHPGPDHPQVFFLLEVRLLEALHEVVVPHRARQVDESHPTIAVG